MTKINFPNQSAAKIDQDKLKLEASIITDLNRIFTNIANDASNIYRLTGNINSRQLAENYAPEILTEIRQAYRKSIKKFGFNLRKEVEKKHNLFFNAERKARLLDFILVHNLSIKQIIEVEDEDLDEKVNQINTDFLVASSFFVANESEVQNDFVTNTNTTMIQNSITAGLFAFSRDQSQRQNDVNDLQSRLFTADPKESAKIARQIDTVNNQISAANNNQQGIVADNIKTNLLDKKLGRSAIIAGQNVGIAEAWARQTEAELIDGANIAISASEEVGIGKQWSSILDSRTRRGRFDHVSPDGQIRRIDEPFDVSGERLMTPRNTSLGASAGNVMNCRCVVIYTVISRPRSF